MAYPTNFEFNGVNLNSIGYTIVSFDGVTTGEQDYEDALSYNISKAANNPQTQIHGFHTESTKKFDFEIECDQVFDSSGCDIYAVAIAFATTTNNQTEPIAECILYTTYSF